MKRLLSLGILSLLLLMSLSGCDINVGIAGSGTPTPASSVTTAASPVASATPSGTPAAQPTATGTDSALADALTHVITAYYNAIKAKDYAQAYTYLDPQATDSNTGKTITQSSFTQQAQEMDNNEGPVVSFDIGVFPPQTQVTMTIMRSHMGPYHAQLDMKQENNTWKIVSLDRI